MQCPKCGETSSTTDYCDQCGAALAGVPAAGANPPSSTPAAASSGRGGSAAPGVTAGSRAGAGATTGPSASADERCPSCDAPRAPLELFCEHCGYDFVSGTLPAIASGVSSSVPLASSTAPTLSSVTSASTAGAATSAPLLAWELEVGVDPARWEANASLRGDEPMPTGTTVVALVTATALIGRRSDSRSIRPEIDTAALTNDPAVSHRHAQLTRQDDGRWSIADLGSANGTTVGGADIVGAPRLLAAGDVVEVGAWTRIAVRSR